MSNITWGLQRAITPRLGARLVQEGNRLHYLADRASITECDAMTAHYYRLREYAMQHPEAHAILRIID